MVKLQRERLDRIETMLQEAEQLIRELARDQQRMDLMYRAIIDSSNHAVIVAQWSDDSDSLVVTHWLGAAEDLFGYGESEALGMSLLRLIPAEYREDHVNGVRRLLQERGPGTYLGKTRDTHGLRKNGERFRIRIALSSFQLTEENERRFAACVLDLEQTADVVDYR